MDNSDAPLWSLPSPYRGGDVHDHGELRPLLVLGQHVALLGGGEAALRAQGELVDIDVLGRLVDAAPDGVLALERAALRRDEAEHHDLLPLRQETQGLEAAGPVGVVFEEIAVD